MNPETTVWRLMAHHEDPDAAARWMSEHSRIAIGWGQIGSLERFGSVDEIASSIRSKYRDYATPRKGGRSLHDFAKVLAIGDQVILTATGKRVAVYEVVGGYEYAPTPTAAIMVEYPHHRRVSRVMADPDSVWRAAGGGPAKTYSRFFPLHPMLNSVRRHSVRFSNGSQN